MTRNSLAVLCAFVSLWLNSSSQITFQKTYGAIATEIGSAVEQTSDGGYIIAGFAESFSAGDSDVYLIKTDAFGDVLWTKTFGGVNNEYGYSVQQTTDGGYIIVGGTRGINISYGRTYLIKTDSNGDSLWTRVFQINDYGAGLSVKQTSDGGYIIAGAAALANNGDITLMKTDPNGNALWIKCIGDTTGSEVPWEVQQTTDGGYVIVGRITDFFGLGDDDVYLARTDSIGNLICAKIFGGYLFDAGFSVVQTTDGGFFITGATYSFGVNEDIYVIRTDDNCDTLWTKVFSGITMLSSLSGRQTSDGGFIVTGLKGNYGVNNYDLYLAKIDSAGNSVWTKSYGDSNTFTGSSVRQTADGGFIILGQYQNIATGNKDVLLLKTDADGFAGCNESDTISIVISPPTGVITRTPIVTSPGNFSSSSQSMSVGSGGNVNTICISDNIQSEISNLQIGIHLSPNPAISQFTTIHSPFPISKVTVFNLVGKKVWMDQFVKSKEEISIDVINLKPGIYFVKVETEYGVAVQKLIKQ